MIEPRGELTLRTIAMPADTNAAGDIFGGWVMAQMDLACGIRAAEIAHGRVVTAAVNEISFRKPMKVGDTLSIHTDLEKVGRTSLTLRVGIGEPLSDDGQRDGDVRHLRDGRARRQRQAQADLVAVNGAQVRRDNASWFHGLGEVV